MTKLTQRARAQAQHVYTLTDELQVRLRVLEESHASVGVHVKPGSSSTQGAIANLGDGDIMAMAFIVLMEAAKSAQDDLRAIMAQVKEINKAKSDQRDLLQSMQSKPSKPSKRPVELDCDGVLQLMLVVYGKQIEAEAEELINDIDSMSEMGEMESLRLQMAMDRMSKMMSTLSNLLKKMSDTNSQIVQNMK